MTHIPSDILAHLILSGNVPEEKVGSTATGDAGNAAFADALAMLLGREPQTDEFAFLTDAEQESLPLTVDLTEITVSEDGTNLAINLTAVTEGTPDALSSVPADLVAAHQLATARAGNDVDVTLPTDAVDAQDETDQPALPHKASTRLQGSLAQHVRDQSGEAAPELISGNAEKVPPPTEHGTVPVQDVLVTDGGPVVASKDSEISPEVLSIKRENAFTETNSAKPQSGHENGNQHIADGAIPVDTDDLLEITKDASTASTKDQARTTVQVEPLSAETAKQSSAKAPQQTTEHGVHTAIVDQDDTASSYSNQEDTHKTESTKVHFGHKESSPIQGASVAESNIAEQMSKQPDANPEAAAGNTEQNVSAVAVHSNEQPEKLIRSQSRSKGADAEPIRHEFAVESKTAPSGAANSTSSEMAPVNEPIPASQQKQSIKPNVAEAQIVHSVNQQSPTGSENLTHNQTTTIQSLANAGQSAEKPATPEPTQSRQFIVETPKPIQVPGQVRVRIEPPGWGHIRVDLTSSGNGIIGTMRIRSEQTRDIVERNIGDLHKSLADAGVRVERLEVVGTSRGDARQPFNPNTPNQNDGGNPWLRDQSQDHSGSPHQHQNGDSQPTGQYHTPAVFANTEIDTPSRVAVGRLDLVA